MNESRGLKFTYKTCEILKYDTKSHFMAKIWESIHKTRNLCSKKTARHDSYKLKVTVKNVICNNPGRWCRASAVGVQ